MPVSDDRPTTAEPTDEMLALARKLRSIYWEGTPPPEDEAFKSWLDMVAVVGAEIATIRTQLAEARKDGERLDKLQRLTTGYGRGWLLRLSSTNRGMRLHETSDAGANRDVRRAIDNFDAALTEGATDGEQG